ncbi:hypothetical protein [Shinella sp. HZN7]|uniref:hypothetical protein n=1 Tax=Shinella sp. (strain HZN7) TaxID=879274 RepID=UPI001FD88B90|nr:hypothetical protein [Shinella sp. HZN7]
MNYGITPEELRSASGDRHRPERQRPDALQPPPCRTRRRVRDGIRDAGGIPIEFPTHPIFENCKRRRRHSTATSPISASSRSSTATRSTASS